MFKTIKDKVQARFSYLARTSQGLLFKTDVNPDAVFQCYLNAIPEAYRQEHNCNCCKAFLRQYGGVVAVSNGKVLTMWEFEAEFIFTEVPAALDQLVRQATIMHRFFTDALYLGTDSNVQRRTDGSVRRWQHFCVQLPNTWPKTPSRDIGTLIGQSCTDRQVFKRALAELSPSATDTVLELIAQNSLYRGNEFKQPLLTLRRHQRAVAGMSPAQLETYTWEHSQEALTIRNTAIGQLLISLSEEQDLDSAVAAYERMVAPANYRRPTALVTAGMLDNAAKVLQALGLDQALFRRHATMDDIPLGEALFVNRAIADKPSLFTTLKDDVHVDSRKFSKVETVPINRFIEEVLPTAHSVEVLFENRHIGNLMNLTAPKFTETPSLFSWPNEIAWVYKDGVADSVKERVKAAGGTVSGDLRVSLEWFNYDDLDLSVKEPGGNRIFYGDKQSARTGGRLDVDMNAGGGTTREAVENIVYPTQLRMQQGTYEVIVHNFRKRESCDVGFNVEIEYDGETQVFTSETSPAHCEYRTVAFIDYHTKKGFSVRGNVSAKQEKAKEVYGMTTQRFQRVSMIVPSPNHWNADRGNLHTFFILDKARTDAPIRGFFNEYLKPELSTHRKVFELLGEKTKIQPADTQLAGLGFSSTQRANLLVRVTSNFTRVINVTF